MKRILSFRLASPRRRALGPRLHVIFVSPSRPSPSRREISGPSRRFPSMVRLLAILGAYLSGAGDMPARMSNPIGAMSGTVSYKPFSYSCIHRDN